MVDKYSGTGQPKGSNKEVVDFNRNIGQYSSQETGKYYNTTTGQIHYSKTGTHIVPSRPNK